MSVFLTGSSAGIVAIAEIGDHPIPTVDNEIAIAFAAG